MKHCIPTEFAILTNHHLIKRICHYFSRTNCNWWGKIYILHFTIPTIPHIWNSLTSKTYFLYIFDCHKSLIISHHCPNFVYPSITKIDEFRKFFKRYYQIGFFQKHFAMKANIRLQESCNQCVWWVFFFKYIDWKTHKFCSRKEYRLYSESW